jgi:hypothetical protein
MGLLMEPHELVIVIINKLKHSAYIINNVLQSNFNNFYFYTNIYTNIIYIINKYFNIKHLK